VRQLETHRAAVTRWKYNNISLAYIANTNEELDEKYADLDAALGIRRPGRSGTVQARYDIPALARNLPKEAQSPSHIPSQGFDQTPLPSPASKEGDP
jgi:alcohol dehydrogenase class IV